MGNYSLERIFPHAKSIQKLIDMDLIEHCGTKVYGGGWTTVVVPEYQMTIPAHMQLCKYYSEQEEIDA